MFLGANPGGAVERSCSLSAGTSILAPLIVVECSRLEEGTPFFGATPAERRACAKGFADQFDRLVLQIDGVNVGDRRGLRVQSPPFAFSPVAGNLFGIPAGTGGSASDGYWALIGPLSPGTSVVHLGGELPAFDFFTDTTYTLSVG